MPYKNIDPTIWGPHLWKFMHYLTLSYPENPTEEEKDTLYNFFYTIQTVLPCEKCRYNFKEHLERTPLTDEVLSNNSSVIKWLYDIHNEVNKSTGKPELPYNEFIQIYSTTKNAPLITPINIKQNNSNRNDSSQNNISFIQKLPQNKKLNKNSFINYLKNNKIVLLLLIVLLIIFVIYLNKKF